MKHVYPVPDSGIDPLAPTIFHEHWWLDIATGGRYDRVEVVSNGKCVGWLPYFIPHSPDDAIIVSLFGQILLL